MAILDTLTQKVNILPTGIPTPVHLSQSENGRTLSFEIIGGSGELPAGSVVTLTGTKPDGVVYSAVGTLSGNIATFEEDVQLTAAAGVWPAKIEVTNGGHMIATGRISFTIDADPVAPGSVPSESELDGLVAQAAMYAENARSAAYGSPLTAATAADMIGTTRVYVYTGNETGMENGHWYYWEDGAWKDGGIYNAAAVQTDTSLSIPGMAADAKATGEAIAAEATAREQADTDLKADLYEFHTVTPIDGYSDQNVTEGTYSTAPYVLRNERNYDYYVTDVVVNVRGPGTITIGTVLQTDVGNGVAYDINKLTIHETVNVSNIGLQSVILSSQMFVPNNAFVFVGLPTDTAQHWYGTEGTDRYFFYVTSGKYSLSSASVNVIVNGYTKTLKVLSASSIYEGKKISILGDSISTFSGYIPEGNLTYYPSGTVTAVSDTWWYKLYTALGMTLDINNSWSGSRVTTTAGEASAGCMTRCEDLGTNPDVIIVWMGINDFNNEVALGTYDGLSALPSVTNTFREAYAIMLNKILTKYQRSEVWVCTLPQCERNAESGFPEINGNDVALAEFNKAILELANAFGVKVLDHNKSGLTYQNMPTFNPDNLHPNKYGHSLVANNDIWQMDNSVRTRYDTT